MDDQVFLSMTRRASSVGAVGLFIISGRRLCLSQQVIDCANEIVDVEGLEKEAAGTVV